MLWYDTHKKITSKRAEGCERPHLGCLLRTPCLLLFFSHGNRLVIVVVRRRCWELDILERDGAFAQELVGTQVLDMVSIRVHGSILVPTRDKFAFIVCSQGRPEVRIPLWKQKVLDEESSQFENAEDE